MNANKFLELWKDIKDIFDEIIEKYDKKWVIRKRSIDTRFLICFIMQLIIRKDHSGYGVTLCEIFNQFLNYGLTTTSKRALAASSLCEARQKLNPSIFKELNQRIIAKWQEYNEKPLLWHGHRLFGIDGSKFTLPRELIKQEYTTPGVHAHYPQGLVSCMYDLLTGIPYDFEMVNHGNERMCVIEHLEQGFQKNAVHVYDRGYFSFELLCDHVKQGAHVVFRIKDNTGYKIIEDFWDSEKKDDIVLLQPPKSVLIQVKKGILNIDLKNPIEVRLIKYYIGENIYVLCTTLIDLNKYPAEIFPGVYHSRWGIEEMLKVSKMITGVHDFHSKNETGCKQELFAHFLLITMMKIFESQSHFEIKEEKKKETTPKRRLRSFLKKTNKNSNVEISGSNKEFTSPVASVNLLTSKKNDNISQSDMETSSIKINTKNSFLRSAGEIIKLLYFKAVEFTEVSVIRLCESMKRLYQKTRPGRSYSRESRKPQNKWCRKTKATYIQ